LGSIGFKSPANFDLVISNLNLFFTLPVGGTLAIVGHSGAGKTTLVDLILRLLEPKSGTVSLDGTDSRLISLESWRKNIGYVAQEVFLLNDTVAANIAFYNPTITTEDIVEAAKMAQIYDFVMTLPDGFKTIVGERGMRLSGGERQRISLARALARKPALLVLDEATSALDGESESLIQKSIEDLKGKITVVAIAHRLSTIMNFDSVVVLEKGAVVETGNPAQLAGNSSTYFYKMVHSNNE
jgi:ABC-type multidrug transport system fused ATPase/permease subunit